MKKFLFVALIAVSMGSQTDLFAQGETKKEKRQRPTPEQIMQMQTDQMVKELMLDDETTAKFTTVYQNYLKELRECRMMNRKSTDVKKEENNEQAKKEAGKRSEMTDTEIADMLKKQFEQSRRMLDIKEKYYEEFSKVLSQKQILRLYHQERQNANKFRSEFERRGKQRPGQRPEGAFQRRPGDMPPMEGAVSD